MEVFKEHPSSLVLRERIESIDQEMVESITHIQGGKEVRRFPKYYDAEKAKNSFKFLYLAAGRIAEAVGKYAPTINDFSIVDFDDEEALLMRVKTAKRKGYNRPCAVPLDPKYEPWAKDVLREFEESDNYPFAYPHIAPESNVRYLQFLADHIFGELGPDKPQLEWTAKDYVKPDIVRVFKKDILDTGINAKNQDVYKIQFEDDDRPKWYTVYDAKHVRKFRKTDIGGWRDFKCHAIRKWRTYSLDIDYLFENKDLELYGGWTTKGIVKIYIGRPEVVPMRQLHREADRYFSKLLKPIDTILSLC